MFIVIIVSLLLSIIYLASPFIRRWQRIYKYLSKIPGPPAVPIIGNVLQFDGTQGIMYFIIKLIQLIFHQEFFCVYIRTNVE